MNVKEETVCNALWLFLFSPRAVTPADRILITDFVFSPDTHTFSFLKILQFRHPAPLRAVQPN